MQLQKVTNTIDELVENMNHSGSVLIATDKEIICNKFFGYADVAKKSIMI